MKFWLKITVIIVILILISMWTKPIIAADTNTVSSTVVTDKSVPTANAPSVVVNNSDICKTAASTAVQTQILGLATGVTITDENCERIKLARSLYSMGMKVAAVSTLCSDYRVFDSMWMAGTYCPYMGAIGVDAKKGWEKNSDLVPKGSKVFSKIELTEQDIKEIKNESDSFTRFMLYGMALYIGFPILF
jgi:hypothetical protein